MSKKIYSEAGYRIRKIRESNNYTRDYVAAKSDISPKFLYEIEGGVKGFSADTLYKISRTLNVSSEYILRGQGESNFDKEISETLALFTPDQLKEIIKTLKSLYKAFNP